ncbi:Alpha/Beta hydrolase protein [Mycena crocata]|nr:Alpha/Beta hydrolase protein [Mycena crocata]
MALSTLPVDVDGTVFSFTDSGHPGNMDGRYITIIAVHGLNYNNVVFKRVQALSAAQNIRFVAINRRGYEGSTPLTEAQCMLPVTGTDEDRERFWHSRGVELANFVDAFIQTNNLPPISTDGTTGGVVLLGWSFGSLFTASAIAAIDGLSDAIQARLKSHLRAHVMHEPPSIAFGLPLPPSNWVPHSDLSIPADQRDEAFSRWITSYFSHGDLSSRSLDVLSYILPSAHRRPTIYDMSAAERAAMIDHRPVEVPGVVMSAAQTNATYRKACYSAEVKRLVPRLKTTLIAGEASASFFQSAMWSIEDDNKAAGGDLKFVVVPGANHFFHWEDAGEALKVYAECA